MNDHNLDDLIIDNIDPKNSKTKSFLTIIALAIVVLIVAIILTKIILKDPNQQVVLEEDNTEMISPELTLQSVTKKEPAKPKSTKTESVKEALSLHAEEKTKPAPVIVKKPVVVEPKKTVAVKPTTVEITKEFSQEPSVVAQKEKEAKLVAQKKVLAEKMAKEKKAAQAKKILEEKRLAEEKVKQEAQAKKELLAKKETATINGYFIQVGSFTQTPSARFLSVIKNSGFNYKITPASSTGTKKLLIGPYASRAEVDTALVRVRDRINKSAFVVKK